MLTFRISERKDRECDSALQACTLRNCNCKTYCEDWENFVKTASKKLVWQPDNGLVSGYILMTTKNGCLMYQTQLGRISEARVEHGSSDHKD